LAPPLPSSSESSPARMARISARRWSRAVAGHSSRLLEPIALIGIAWLRRNEERFVIPQPRSPGRGFSFCVASQSATAGRRPARFPHLVRGGRPPQNAHSCDRRHIASAMVELGSYLWIVPHMRSFYVPPILSPAHAGLFSAPRDFLRRGDLHVPQNLDGALLYRSRKLSRCHDY
jgi:hypothetical protein